MFSLVRKQTLGSVSNILCLYILFAVTLASCKPPAEPYNEWYSQLIKEAGKFVEAYPAKGLEMLKGVNAGELNEYDSHYYMLVKARLYAAVGINITSMKSDVRSAYDFFSHQYKKDTAAIVLGYFVMAKVNEAANDPGNAYTYYQGADTWAQQLEYDIPGIIYSAIPYNIAFHAKRFKEYRKSLAYLDKMEMHIDTANNPKQRYHLLYSMELRGINYMYLNKPDSAFYFYDRGMDLADKLGDLSAKNRIICNRIELLADLADPYEAERRSKELLKSYMHANDSLFIGLTNISLAKIYINLSHFDKAYACIDKAIEFIDKRDTPNQLLITQQLRVIHARDTNHKRLAEYIYKIDFMLFQNEYPRFSNELQYLSRRKLGHLLSHNLSYDSYGML